MQTYIDVSWTFEVVEKIPLQQIGDRRMIRNEDFLELQRLAKWYKNMDMDNITGY